MKIAVIGAGNVGAALAVALDRAGHQLFLGVRDPLAAKIKTIVQQNPRITALGINDTVAQADVIILAVPADAVIDVIRQFGDVQEKIIIDATNSLFSAPKPCKNAAEALTALTNVKHFAKCFNSTGYENMQNPGYGETAADMFVAGDSVAAKKAAVALAKDIGFAECYDFGGFDKIPLLEQLALVWINLAIVQKQGRSMAIKLLKRS
ncbi:MAG: NADPH-dependent F420 reductase [Calditrichaeota bacterium]|nr:MAG: NADPH-dependent F420 reductase [Calditrichota bacterium]